MKLMIGFAAILSCYLALGILLSCSYEPESPAPQPEKTPKEAPVVSEEETQSEPPVLVQQFSGCKAHR